MKKIITLISLFTLCLAQTVLADGVKVKATLNPTSMLIGQQADLALDITAPKSVSVIMPSIEAPVSSDQIQMIAPGVEVLDVKTDTVEVDANTVQYTRHYTLTCFEESKNVIPALEVKVGSKPYKTNAIDLNVATVEVDTTNVDKFFPPKDVQNVPFQWAEWSPYFWLSILVILLVFVGIYLFVRIKQNKPIISRIIIIKHIPAHQKALTAIGKIKVEPKEAEDSQKVYYTKLTDTLREYIRERFGFNAMEMTSGEIIEQLQKAGDETMIDELRELFRTADLVKFAKHTPGISEDDLNLVNAVNYIDQTKTEDKPTEEKVVPELSEADKKQNTHRTVAKTLLWIVSIVAVVLLVYVFVNVINLLY